MKTAEVEKIVFNDYVGCFGAFNSKDAICEKLCAINLRCAIECNQKAQMDIIEDLMYSACMPARFQ